MLEKKEDLEPIVKLLLRSLGTEGQVESKERRRKRGMETADAGEAGNRGTTLMA